MGIWEKIFHVAQKEGMVPVGLGARDTLRLEAGLPLFGHEFGLDPEAKEIPILVCWCRENRGQFFSREGRLHRKGSLMETVPRTQEPGGGPDGFIPANPLVGRRVLPVALSAEGVARPQFPIYVDDSTVGHVISGTMVPYWKFDGKGIYSTITRATGRKAIVLAYLDAQLKDGQAIKVFSRQKFLAGQVVQRNLSAEAPPYARPVHVVQFSPKKLGPREPLEFSITTLVNKAIQKHYLETKTGHQPYPFGANPLPLGKTIIHRGSVFPVCRAQTF